MLAANVAKPLDRASVELLWRALGLLDRQTYLVRSLEADPPAAATQSNHRDGGRLVVISERTAPVERTSDAREALEQSLLEPRCLAADKAQGREKLSVASLVVQALSACAASRRSGSSSEKAVQEESAEDGWMMKFELCVQNAICDAARVLKHLAEPSKSCEAVLKAGAGNAAAAVLLLYTDHLEVAENLCGTLRQLIRPRKHGSPESSRHRVLAARSVAPAVLAVMKNMAGTASEAKAFDAALQAACGISSILAEQQEQLARVGPGSVDLQPLYAVAAQLLRTPAGQIALQHTGAKDMATFARDMQRLGLPKSAERYPH